MSTFGEKFFFEKGFGTSTGFGDRCALIVVDMMKAFTDPSRKLGSNQPEAINQINHLTENARKADVPVFFSIIAYEEEDCADGGIWRYKIKGNYELIAGTKNVELDDRIIKEPKDAVITKKYASVFFGTDLVSRLNSKNVDTVALTGVTTSGCVRASAVDSVSYGFRTIVVSDAVGDRSEVAHRQSLVDINHKYADVLNTDEVISHWHGNNHIK